MIRDRSSRFYGAGERRATCPPLFVLAGAVPRLTESPERDLRRPDPDMRLDEIVADLDYVQCWSRRRTRMAILDHITPVFSTTAAMDCRSDAFAADFVAHRQRRDGCVVLPGRSVYIRGRMVGERTRTAPTWPLRWSVKRVPWYGPAMGVTSSSCALMETWHTARVAAFGWRAVRGTIRHVAHIGVRARPFSYLVMACRARCDVPFALLHRR